MSRRPTLRLQVGGNYRLPSGNTVRLNALPPGPRSVAQCSYVGRVGTSVLDRGDEVAFLPAWLRRYGQLNWGG